MLEFTGEDLYLIFASHSKFNNVEKKHENKLIFPNATHIGRFIITMNSTYCQMADYMLKKKFLQELDTFMNFYMHIQENYYQI